MAKPSPPTLTVEITAKVNGRATSTTTITVDDLATMAILAAGLRAVVDRADGTAPPTKCGWCDGDLDSVNVVVVCGWCADA